MSRPHPNETEQLLQHGVHEPDLAVVGGLAVGGRRRRWRCTTARSRGTARAGRGSACTGSTASRRGSRAPTASPSRPAPSRARPRGNGGSGRSRGRSPSARPMFTLAVIPNVVYPAACITSGSVGTSWGRRLSRISCPISRIWVRDHEPGVHPVLERVERREERRGGGRRPRRRALGGGEHDAVRRRAGSGRARCPADTRTRAGGPRAACRRGSRPRSGARPGAGSAPRAATAMATASRAAAGFRAPTGAGPRRASDQAMVMTGAARVKRVATLRRIPYALFVGGITGAPR